MDRLSAQDTSFLYIENECNPMHIGVVAIFEGPAPHHDEIEEMVSSKLHLVPRYRQRVRFVPFEIGRPIWCDDPHFNLRYHVRHSALPSPGAGSQLRTLVGRVMSQQLDRAKPLWEMWVVEGLEKERWAILSKVHHSMVDGIAGTDLLSVIMDDEPDREHPAPHWWRAAPPPSALELLGDAIQEKLSSPREAFAALRTAVEAPRRALRTLSELGDGLGSFSRLSDSELDSSLNGPIGPHRRWCWSETTLSEVKRIREAHGGTVNDIVLAAITRGFRALLLSRDEEVEDRVVRTLVPVSVRRRDERGSYNNRVAAIFAELPVGIEDPLERLGAIREQMKHLKAHHQAVAAETLTALTGFAPPMLLALAGRLFADVEQHSVQTVTTNVPGPQRTLYAAGRPMLTAYPYVPLAVSIRVGIAIFSYAGQLTFGVTGDYDGAPDIEVLAEGIGAGIEELLSKG
ncbi:MAG: wax ester/triacylglycerol synthase family O-acyltransferase [Deltaproteobacteria bacterium]|nr:wax ester/triacylglycerol synthase family O-acyltransferase [Deltaproteobacteria bacterium]MBW2417278.1 wax ester/triacylglycerol synthase family O-acyltransferase [Deltaproteobacteria bacterium]